MVSAGDFKNGLTIQMDNNIWQIIEFQHVKPGKGAAFVRTKLKNIVSGGVVEKSFRPTEKFDLAHIEKREYQYLYSDGDLYNFMDTETFEQHENAWSRFVPDDETMENRYKNKEAKKHVCFSR